MGRKSSYEKVMYQNKMEKMGRMGTIKKDNKKDKGE